MWETIYKNILRLISSAFSSFSTIEYGKAYTDLLRVYFIYYDIFFSKFAGTIFRYSILECRRVRIIEKRRIGQACKKEFQRIARPTWRVCERTTSPKGQRNSRRYSVCTTRLMWGTSTRQLSHF
jgi:hypothetical protein